MIGLNIGITAQQRRGGLRLVVSDRGADGTALTLKITGTFRATVTDRNADGTALTLKVA